METLETIVAMLETLSEDELKIIYEVTKSFFINKISINLFKPLLEDEIITKLNLAKGHADQGLYKDATEISKEIKEKYGL